MVYRKNKKIYYFITIVISVIFVFFILNLNKRNVQSTIEESIPIQIYHAHVDFKVFLNGDGLNFNKPKYHEANRFVHLHLNAYNGDKVIHIEGMANVSIGFFFKTLGIEFNSTCFVLDTKEGFCNNESKKMRFFVNGKENFEFDLYEPGDLDRILITYGNETEEQIKKQTIGITDYACIFSLKCPERIPTSPIARELEF